MYGGRDEEKYDQSLAPARDPGTTAGVVGEGRVVQVVF